ncbi:hypothetical protein ACFY8P_06895 [Streptomyces sp. NPDC012693]|uniref:hypothetical protein n=1 Tax=unclassified Streptomyces TaxID=2593676 RepID=UPI00202ECF52|nr:hypothetical protein [Streptomyces sp. MSC1_001]
MGPGPHSLNAIISNTSLSRSTVQRIVQSGLRTGVMLQARHGHYALTPTREAPPGPARPSALRAGVRTTDPADLRMEEISSSRAVHREIHALRERLGHTVSLHAAILLGVPSQTCVKRFPGSQGSPPDSAPGIVRPLEADAAGLSILAHLDRSSGSTEYQHIRSRGFSLSRGTAPDWFMLAVPVLRSDIPIGAISVTGRHRELEQHGLRTAVAALKASRARLTRLGLQPS